MLSWQEFETSAPAIAAAGRKLLYQFGPGLSFLATVRRDGAPRLHPICPTIVDGALCAFILPASPKCADLRRDGRYALHTFPCPQVDDEFLLMGRAILIEDSQRREAILADLHGRGVKSSETELAFEFRIDRAMHAAYDGPHGTWPPKYSIWKES
jgi:hypothetical protein